MGLRIQHNISAMNAHRNLSISDAGLAKSLERLSSGYRINKAADDAAGLAISNAFRADLASLKVASRNASEASSLLQVAEGAADQIQNMLVRLKELATQAASANVGSADRTKIDTEKTKLLAEIDKIANSTEYSDTALINGTYGVSVSATGGKITTANGFDSLTGMKQGYSYVLNIIDTGANSLDVEITAYNGSGTVVGTETVYDKTTPTGSATTEVAFNGLGVTLTVNSGVAETINGGASAMVEAAQSGSASFQVGAEDGADNRIVIDLGDMTTNSGLGISGIDLTTTSGAQGALTTIDTAIGSLNTRRGTIGAYMNQLGYHAANLSTTIENLQAAESVIRDVDMAAEMTDFTKNQILLQAGTAMLAQANMAPQNILSLIGR